MTAKQDSVSMRFFSFVNGSVIKSIFHQVFFRNQTVMAIVWGVKVPPLLKTLPFGTGYTDLSGFLLRRVLTRLIQSRNLRRVHEIGIGQYGIMCIYMRKRFPQLSISGSTISQLEIENSSRAVTLNGLQIPFYVSDVLADFKGDPVQMIWWNLPYYDSQILEYLRRLFVQVQEKKALVDRGLVVLATNTVLLRAEAIATLVDSFGHLRVIEVKRGFWNPHAILTIEYRQVR